ILRLQLRSSLLLLQPILFPPIVLPPPRSTLFPYTTLFRSMASVANLVYVRGAKTLLHRDVARIRRALRAPEVRHELLHSSRGERSEEHTSELQSLRHLVCRLLLEKKN